MVTLRSAQPADVPLILQFIRELAEYEREPNAVLANEADLLRDGFGPVKQFHCILADWNGQPAGFALWFYNFSTWRGRAGIHLEDLFVRTIYRGHGIGKALLKRIAAIAVEQGCVRLQWNVLDWNQTAIGFYEKMGAEMLNEWRIIRIADDALRQLADESETGNND